MNIRFVPFEEIDKNKWNGTVHYAQNGNVFGYYWYLKSVVKEWDAFVEGDYQSVMPVPRTKLNALQKSLLPFLGPYTVNEISEKRILSFYRLWEIKYFNTFYAFNDQITEYIPEPKTIKKISCIDMSDGYEAIFDKYTEPVKSILNQISINDYVFSNVGKPEIFLGKDALSEADKNILYRLFYNAIQRGIGFSLKVENPKKNHWQKHFL
ncbi:MAG: hypothetical protein IPO92_02970 [Saprospiraceae bacterium]|nr:hypothetical protein [Saprospiraceae bacterium]